MNAGNYVVLPTNRAIKLWTYWVRSFWLTIHKQDYVMDQLGLKKLWHEGLYAVCESLAECKKEYRSHRPLVRMHRVPWYPKPTMNNRYEQQEAMCALNPFFIRPDGKPRLQPPKVDPCDPMLVYIHILCQLDRFDHDARIESKMVCLKLANMWFMKHKGIRGRCPLKQLYGIGAQRTNLRFCQPDHTFGIRSCNTSIGFQGLD